MVRLGGLTPFSAMGGRVATAATDDIQAPFTTAGRASHRIRGHAHRDFRAGTSHTPSGSSPCGTLPSGRMRAGRSDTRDAFTTTERPWFRNALAIGPNVLAPVDAPAQPAQEESTARRTWPVIGEGGWGISAKAVTPDTQPGLGVPHTHTRRHHSQEELARHSLGIGSHKRTRRPWCRLALRHVRGLAAHTHNRGPAGGHHPASERRGEMPDTFFRTR